ncbi:hypothetical protein QOT17_021687 [Balamuthia mandrillaris]
MKEATLRAPTSHQDRRNPNPLSYPAQQQRTASRSPATTELQVWHHEEIDFEDPAASFSSSRREERRRGGGGGRAARPQSASRDDDSEERVLLERPSSSSSASYEPPEWREGEAVDGTEEEGGGEEDEEMVRAQIRNENKAALMKRKTGHGKGSGYDDGGSERIEEVGTTSASSTFFNMMKSYIGGGILGMPYGFKQGGLLSGVLTLLVVAVFSNYCMRVLIACKNRARSQGHRVCDFEHLGRLVLGTFGHWFVVIALVFTQLGFCIAYVIFIAENMHAIAQSLSTTQWALIAFPVITGVALIRSWKLLAPGSMLGSASLCAGVGIVFVYSMMSLRQKLSEHGMKWFDQIDLYTFETYPLFFGVAVYTYEGIGLVIPMEKAMREPRRYNSVLNSCYVSSTALYILFGVGGYIGFGEATSSVVTQNVDEFIRSHHNGGIGADEMMALGGENVIPMLVKVILVVALYFTYPIQLYPVSAMLDNALFTPSTKYLFFWRSLSRTCLVGLTVAAAILVPDFGLVVSFIGALGASTLAFILPGLIHLVQFWGEMSEFGRAWDLLVIAFGVLVVVVGTSLSVYELVGVLNAHHY